MRKRTVLLTLVVLGAACWAAEKVKDRILSPKEQETYLLGARDPRRFDFQVFRLRNGALGYRGSARLHPRHFATLELLEDTIPLVRIRGKSRRQKMNLLFDTSSPVSWMEFGVSRKFDAYFLGVDKQVFPYRGTYNTGGAPAYAAVVTQLRLEDLFMENIPFYVRMAVGSLGPLARGIIDPKVDAVLGYDNLRVFQYVRFDLSRRRITLSADTPYEPPEGVKVYKARIIADAADRYGLVVEGAVNDEPAPIVLDIAGNYDFARGDIRVGTTAAVRVGNLEALDVPTLLLPKKSLPARLGRHFLQNYAVVVCNRKGLVYFEEHPGKKKKK